MKKIVSLAAAIFVFSTVQCQEIFAAIDLGDVEAVKEIAQKDPRQVNELNKDGETPLYKAIAYSADQIIAALIEAGVDVNKVNKNGDTPLHVAIKKQDQALIKQLLDAGADINKQDVQGRTPLYIALLTDNEATVKQLLKNKHIDSDKPNSNGMTPLQLASIRSKFELMQLIVDAGADINKENKFGNTPLMQAVAFADEKKVIFLLNNGADPNKANTKGSTPLHVIVGMMYDNVLRIAWLLLEAGADVNKRDKKGDTPLHTAASFLGREQIIKLFLKYNADRKIKNKKRATAYGVAKKYGYTNMASLLEPLH